jgi:TolB-like protein/DNA-binding winged helix-turn-helix (wHTH) protein/Flp pilus assembly protein TadD
MVAITCLPAHIMSLRMAVEGDFKVGEWMVTPTLNQIGSNGSSTRVEPKAMQVLLYLAEHPGVVSKEKLLSSVWPDVFVSEDVLPGCISALRKAFNDNARRPTVIETIPKGGYRLLLPVAPANGTTHAASATTHVPASGLSRRRLAIVALAISAAALLLAAFTRLPSRRLYDSVAVLPFVDFSSDSRTEYLSQGIAEQVVDELSQLNALKVMAWTSVSRYRQSQRDVRAIGRELGVKAVLTGTLERNGDQVALQAELVDVSNGSQLWGQRYDQPLADISGLQHHLAQDIAANLRLKLRGDEQQRMEHRYQASPAAYELYLKGRFFWGKRTKTGLDQGIQYFHQAIALDPNFALAYAGLADCYNLLDDWGQTAPRDSFPQARAAAEKAIALDDSLAEAHVSLAMVRGAYDWDWAGSEQEFKRAIQLNPNYVTAHQWYGMALASLGRFAEAEAEVKRARELDPLSPIVNMAVAEVYAWGGRYDEAIAQYKRVLELDPSFSGAYGNLAGSYEQKHMYTEAVSIMKQKAMLDGDPKFAAAIDQAFAKSGYSGVVRVGLNDALEERNRNYVNPVGIASEYARLGDTEHALQWLERGYEEHASGMQYLAVIEDFDGIRSDPRFRYWMSVLNLPEGTRAATSKPQSN